VTAEYRVLLFARYAELFGAPEVVVALPAPTTRESLVDALRRLPGGVSLPASPFLTRNGVHAVVGDVVHPRDELALLPPMAGG
jgi:molybdopterin converting factor small subunit